MKEYSQCKFLTIIVIPASSEWGFLQGKSTERGLIVFRKADGSHTDSRQNTTHFVT